MALLLNTKKGGYLMKNIWPFIRAVFGFIILLICLINIILYFGVEDKTYFYPIGYSFNINEGVTVVNSIFFITLILLSLLTIYFNVKYIVLKDKVNIAKFSTYLLLFFSIIIPFSIGIISFIV